MPRLYGGGGCGNKHKFMHKPFNAFIFRTPYFPVSALCDFEAKQDSSVFKEMLQIASPDLSQMLETSDDKAQYSAYRYYHWCAN